MAPLPPVSQAAQFAAVPYWFRSWKKTCNSHAVLGSGTDCVISNGRKDIDPGPADIPTAQHPRFHRANPPLVLVYRPSGFLTDRTIRRARNPGWVQEAYVKRVFVVEKMRAGRQPLWDRKNQSRARSPGRYQNVTLIIASHTKLPLQSQALLYGFRHNSARILSSCQDLNWEDCSLNLRKNAFTQDGT